jgi:hypothetical protein
MGTPSTGWWMVTSRDDLEGWSEASLAYPAHLADRFARRESREQAANSLRGLVAPVERTNGWQVAEAVGDATPRGHGFLDRRPSLPEAWGKVLEGVGFSTKPEHTIALRARLGAGGVDVVDDRGEVYGDAPRLRETVERHGRREVLAVLSPTPVWSERPPVVGIPRDPGGPAPGPGCGWRRGLPTTVEAVALPLPARSPELGWRGRGGDEPSTGEPGTAAPVVTRSKTSTIVHE